MLTTFQNPSQASTKPKPDVGLDFGIETQVITSDAIKFKFTVPEDKRLKLLQRKLGRKIEKIKKIS